MKPAKSFASFSQQQIKRGHLDINHGFHLSWSLFQINSYLLVVLLLVVCQLKHKCTDISTLAFRLFFCIERVAHSTPRSSEIGMFGKLVNLLRIYSPPYPQYLSAFMVFVTRSLNIGTE
uniref:Uncharacterized protein n=1 Tax=Rhizophora mucronata TaxID=61149 RepID=A0A2P2MS75_RHIMU